MEFYDHACLPGFFVILDCICDLVTDNNRIGFIMKPGLLNDRKHKRRKIYV